MCLGVPARVIEARDMDARVDALGEERFVNVMLLDEPPAAGDWVLVHLGLAVRRIPPEDVADVLATFEAMRPHDVAG